MRSRAERPAYLRDPCGLSLDPPKRLGPETGAIDNAANGMPLKPFQPGHDPRRNLKGRGRGKLSIPDLLRRIGEKRLPADLKGKAPPFIAKDARLMEALMARVWEMALAGESWAVQFIAERTEGKVKDVLTFEPDDQAAEAARKLLAEAT